MEARNRTLPEWMMRIRTRQIVLPRFQRMEAWGYKEITDLLEAVLHGLPVGSVLILEVGDKIPFVSRPMAGAPVDGERIVELLLDGQQRLTALWRAFNNNYGGRTYFIQIPEKTGDEIEVVSVSHWFKNSRRYPIWVDDPVVCWERRLVPIHVLCPGEDGEADMDNWVNHVIDNTDFREDKSDAQKAELKVQLSRELFKHRNKVAQFNLPFLSLPVKTAKDVALDVFIKMNTRTVRLTTFDIIVAQTEESTGESLHDLVSGLVGNIPALTHYDAPEDLALGSMALLQDRIPSQKGFLGLDLEEMVSEWKNLEKGSRNAVEFLEDECIFDKERLPTESIMAPIIALWTFVPDLPDKIGNARILLRKYIWRAFFTDRYERAAATAALQDFRALRDVITKGLPEDQVPCFNEKVHNLPSLEELKHASWPKKRDRLARAILTTSLLGGAHDIADSIPVRRDNLKRREYHHLFPIAHLRDCSIDEKNAHRALNCALISWKTNRTISSKEPVNYLRDRTEATTLGEEEIKRRLKTHGVNMLDLINGDYELFLENRARMVEHAMRELCSGKKWKPQDFVY